MAKDGKGVSKFLFSRLSFLKNDGVQALLFLLPALIALALFRLWPFLSALFDSFHRINPSGDTQIFVGLENYRFLFNSSIFRNSLKVTLIFTLLVNPIQIVIALVLAVILVQKIPGANLLRTIIFLPVAVPPAITALIWGMILRPDGILNSFLTSIGLPAQPFLTSPAQSLPSIILILTWAGAGYWMVFLIAGLKEIPGEIFEAASIDGASWWQAFRLITLPLIKKTLAFVLVADTIVNFVVFAYIQVLTKGGPSGTTDLIMHQIYRQVYQFGNRNIGAAQTVILMVIVLIIVVGQYRIMSRE